MCQPASAPGTIKFTDITDQVGLDFVHTTGPQEGFHFAEIMAGGAALFDYDGDGDLDIYLTNGHFGLAKTDSSKGARNRLYRQESDGSFTDVTDASGLGDQGYGMGVALGDIDNDGDTDVYVTNFGQDALYANQGDGTFVDVTARAGINVAGWSCSAIFLDYDLDGFLDLYVARYLEFNPRSKCYDQAGRRDYCGPTAGPPLTDVLLHNNGDGTFTDVTAAAGIAATAATGLGVVSGDFNEDGWPDIYVANDGYANHLWTNLQDGTFRDDAFLMGVALNMNGKAEAGMGVAAADLDNDLDLDLFMTHLRDESNTFYRNRGPELGFDDASAMSGLGGSSVPFTGFGTATLDVDLDGDLDVLVVNGRVIRGPLRADADLAKPWDVYAEPNLLYVNQGGGQFTPTEAITVTLDLGVEISRGLAIGDIDRDGDLDLLVANLRGPARLFRNDTARSGHWVQIQAIDPKLNRDAIGAKVMIVFGGNRSCRTIGGGCSYLSAQEPIAYFGLGQADRVDSYEVHWPGGGLRERFPGTPADRRIKLVRGAGEAVR